MAGHSSTRPAPPAAATSGLAYDAVLRPVRQGNAFEETVERLLQAIRLGVAPVGERLPPERDLATRLGVSRATVREALAALQRAGFVESRRGRYGGTFVRALPAPPQPGAALPSDPAAGRLHEQLDDVLAMRHVVEVGAAELAATRPLEPPEVEHLLQVLGECHRCEPDDYRRADSRLHLAIAELSGSPSLTAAVADVRVRLNEMLDAIPLLEKNIRHSDAQHERIVAAVLADRPERARTAMAEHLDGSAALLRGFLG
jgi:DNA-binding FadR family transcriptional regulator